MTNDQIFGEEIYSAYAAGSLDPGLSLMLETQAALRQDVYRKLHFADAISGAFLEREAPSELASDALEKTFALIDRQEDQQKQGKIAARMAGGLLNELIRLPEPLRDKAFEAGERAGWKFAGQGIRVMPISIPSEATVELLRIEPKCAAPRHSHGGQEYTLVVQGGFTDETGSYGPGDVSIAVDDFEHQPVADADEVCIALVVRDGNLKFTGILGALQKIFG